MNKTSIALVNPSSPSPLERFERALLRAPQVGFNVVSSGMTMPSAPTFFTAAKKDRLKELKAAEESGAQAIWCVRGGCGAIELWQDYDARFYSKNSAPLMGYSDNTVVLFMRFYFGQRIGIHSPGFLELDKLGAEDCDVLHRIIHKTARSVIYPALKSIGPPQPLVEGELIPMNLCSLQSLLGCFDPGFFRGKILAIEDINEPHYKVFRMMQHLRNAGVLSGLKALVVGHFNKDREEIIEKTMRPLAEAFGIPLFDWPIFGHDEPNWPLLFGARVQIAHQEGCWSQLIYLEEHDGAR